MFSVEDSIGGSEIVVVCGAAQLPLPLERGALGGRQDGSAAGRGVGGLARAAHGARVDGGADVVGR